ncbi:MAG: preprotein translocase subunit SecG [Verrucomicrobia bacterium]|nr:preprotein translocase subunit SecG [Verrucomicrobiota bacterium]
MVIVCVLLTLVVLMQRPKNEGLGAAFGSGVTENIFGAQTTTVLTKTTVYLGSIFFALTLILTVLTARQSLDRRVGLLENETRKTAGGLHPKIILPSPAATSAPKAASNSTPTGTPTPSEIHPVASATPGSSPLPLPATSGAQNNVVPSATPAEPAKALFPTASPIGSPSKP